MSVSVTAAASAVSCRMQGSDTCLFLIGLLQAPFSADRSLQLFSAACGGCGKEEGHY